MTATPSYDRIPKTIRARNRKGDPSHLTITSAITCEVVTNRMGNYICNDLAVHEHRSLEAHLNACTDCLALLSTYKKTIELTRGCLTRERREVLPVHFKLRLPSGL